MFRAIQGNVVAGGGCSQCSQIFEQCQHSLWFRIGPVCFTFILASFLYMVSYILSIIPKLWATDCVRKKVSSGKVIAEPIWGKYWIWNFSSKFNSWKMVNCNFIEPDFILSPPPSSQHSAQVWRGFSLSIKYITVSMSSSFIIFSLHSQHFNWPACSD